jgi:hypothetical protein
MYSQNGEDTIALDYFTQKNTEIRTLLDIGANDGITFSNSKLLIKNGWGAVLLEPSEIAFNKCYQNNIPYFDQNLQVYNFGIANETGEQEFLESGSHLLHGNDIALLSSVPSRLTERWKKEVDFTHSKAMFYTFADFEKLFLNENSKFSYLTIDAEGYDYDIVKQIDLNKYGVQMLCIEWNGDNELMEKYTAYSKGFGLSELCRNAENMIFAL